MSEKKKESSSLIGAVVLFFVAVGVIANLWEKEPVFFSLLFLMPILASVFVALGKMKDHRLNRTVPLVVFGLVFWLWGVPNFHTPLWNAVNQFKHSVEGKDYFLDKKMLESDLETENINLSYQLGQIKEAKENLRDYPNEDWPKSDLAEARRAYKEAKEAKKILLAQIKKSSFNPLEIRHIADVKTQDRFKQFNKDMMESLIVMLLFSILCFFIGRKRAEKEDAFITKMGVLALWPFLAVYNLVWPNRRKKVEGFAFSNDKGGYLTDSNLSLHTQVVGGSGVGKTNFLKAFIADRTSKDKGLIFLDFKADFEVQEWLMGLATETGRNDLKILSLSRPQESVPYNPIEHGSASEITSQLMNSLKWSEEFYKNYAENALLSSLNLLCYLRDRDGLKFHLGHVLKILSDNKYRYHLLSLADGMPFKSQIGEMFLELDEQKSAEKLSGLIIQLKKILFSDAGAIFTSRVEEFQALNFRDSIRKGEIVYICMNSMGLKEVASVAGKMILQDLMKEIGHIYDEGLAGKQTSVVIDEFASFATPDFVGFIDKARGAGIELMLAHQSMADLNEISENFGKRILENTASKVIFNTLSADEAEMFASMIGTQEEIEETTQVDRKRIWGDETGMGSRRTVEKFAVHPNVFKQLERGQAVVVASKVDKHYGIVNIVRAPEFKNWSPDCAPIPQPNHEQRYLDFNVGQELPTMGRVASNEKPNSLSDGIDGI